MMLFIEYINVHTSGRWQKILGRRLWPHYSLALSENTLRVKDTRTTASEPSQVTSGLSIKIPVTFSFNLTPA